MTLDQAAVSGYNTQTKVKINWTMSKLKTLYIKGYYQQKEKGTHGIGESIYKLYIWQSISRYITPITQQQKQTS